MSQATCPSIRKAKCVKGKTLTFRDAHVGDAEFILSLRTDEIKSRYLSKTSANLDSQQAWLESYAISNDQAYFIIEYQSVPIGTVRLYDGRGNSFCWGSWILMEGRPGHAAIESALMVYSYAVDDLGFQSAHFDVRKGNERVWKFHERFGANRISETEQDYFYELSLSAIRSARENYARHLPSNVSVIR